MSWRRRMCWSMRTARRQRRRFAAATRSECFSVAGARTALRPWRTRKPHPTAPVHEQPGDWWGDSQTRVNGADFASLDQLVVGMGESVARTSRLWRCAVSPAKGWSSCPASRQAPQLPIPCAGRHGARRVSRCRQRRRLCRTWTTTGLLAQIQLDMGQVICGHATAGLSQRTVGRDAMTTRCRTNTVSPQEVLIEYTAHPDACFHLWDGQTTARWPKSKAPRATCLCKLWQRLPSGSPCGRSSGGAAGRWRCGCTCTARRGSICHRVGRHRQPNPSWFEDYGAEFVHVEPAGLAFRGRQSVQAGRHPPSVHVCGEAK